jgi:hypothetical protein
LFETPAYSTVRSWRNTDAQATSSAIAQLTRKNHPIPIKNQYTISLLMKAAPTTRKPLRSVSIDPGPRSFDGTAVLAYDFVHGVQTAKSRQSRVPKGTLDLPDPEIHCALNPSGHFRHNGFN